MEFLLRTMNEVRVVYFELTTFYHSAFRRVRAEFLPGNIQPLRRKPAAKPQDARGLQEIKFAFKFRGGRIDLFS